MRSASCVRRGYALGPAYATLTRACQWRIWALTLSSARVHCCCRSCKMPSQIGCSCPPFWALQSDAWCGMFVSAMQEGQPLQLHSAGHSSVPPLDASSETPYAERDEESSNTIAEPVPGV